MNENSTATSLSNTATLAAGCFWGVEDILMSTPGVVSTRVGYTGGHTQNPTYRDVCSGDTGHAEAVEVTFDPTVLSYEQLLEAFFKLHDPTTLNRQGPDVGSQYRSAIFYHDTAQREMAMAVKSRLEAAKIYGDKPIVTEVVAATQFYPAEEYHQKYFQKNPDDPRVCHVR